MSWGFVAVQATSTICKIQGDKIKRERLREQQIKEYYNAIGLPLMDVEDIGQIMRVDSMHGLASFDPMASVRSEPTQSKEAEYSPKVSSRRKFKWNVKPKKQWPI